MQRFNWARKRACFFRPLEDEPTSVKDFKLSWKRFSETPPFLPLFPKSAWEILGAVELVLLQI
jgi:hypothetical protein